jgi:hypothetical protein
VAELSFYIGPKIILPHALILISLAQSYYSAAILRSPGIGEIVSLTPNISIVTRKHSERSNGMNSKKQLSLFLDQLIQKLAQLIQYIIFFL